MKKSSLSKVVEKPNVGRGHPRTGRMAPEMGGPIQNAPPSKKKGKTKMSNIGEMNQPSYGGPSSPIIMMGPGGSVGGMMGGPLPRIMGPGGSVGSMMGGTWPRTTGPGESIGSMMGGPRPRMMSPEGMGGRHLDQVFAKPQNPDNPGTSQSRSVPRGPLPESKENVEALKPKVTTSKIKSGSIKTELWRPYSPSPSLKAKREPLKELAVPRNLERIGGSKSISNQKIPILENVEAPKVPTIWDFKIKIGGMNESSSSPEEDKSIKRNLEKIGSAELVDSLSNQKIPMFENVKAPKVPTLEIEIGGRNESSSSPGEDKNILRNLEKIGSAESEDSKNNQKDPEFKALKLTIKSADWYVKAESKMKDHHSNKTPTSLPSQKPRRRKHEARKKLTRTELLIKDLQEEILPLRAKKVPPPATSNASKK